MMELSLIFLSGLLGSAHCIGMCGGFALSIGVGSKSWKNNLARQTSYTLGRAFTYTFLGALVAFFGYQLAEKFPSLVNIPAALAMIAGCFLVYQGLQATGVFQKKGILSTGGPCLSGSLFRTFLTAPGLANAFFAGMLTGLLPCGLLYAMLMLAGSTRHLFWGAGLMAVFALGTAPAMIATGYGGSLISITARQKVMQVAAWCVVLTGLLSIYRGVCFVYWPNTVEAAGSCPFCL